MIPVARRLVEYWSERRSKLALAVTRSDEPFVIARKEVMRFIQLLL